MPKKISKTKEESEYRNLTGLEFNTTPSKKSKTSTKLNKVEGTEKVLQTNLHLSPKKVRSKTSRTTPSILDKETITEKNQNTRTEQTSTLINSKIEAKRQRKTKPEVSELQKSKIDEAKIFPTNEIGENLTNLDTKKTRKKAQLKSEIAAKETEEKPTTETTKKQSATKKAKNTIQTKEPSKPTFEEEEKKGKKTKEETKAESKYELAEEIEVPAKAKLSQAKPQVRYSDEDLEMFRKRILEVKSEALEELSMLRERLEDLNSYDLAEEGSIYSMHMAEQGSEIAEKEKVYAQIQRINEYIKKLDEALKRIDDKTYGICRVCGILIAKERLLAVPITTLSASYKIHKKCPEDGIDRIEPVAK
ncbi:MAG: TraR/DksA family transcriptional regulator [Candidatus Kapaibacteriales bacterium]